MATRSPDKPPPAAAALEERAAASSATASVESSAPSGDELSASASQASLDALPLSELGIDRTNQRQIPADFRGDVYIWDVDKTYLDTPFDSIKGLMRIPFEAAVDKRAFPGTAQLLKELRRGPGTRPIGAPLFFISASPSKLRAVLEKKMLLDGVEFDGLTLKDPVQNVRRGGWKALKAQLAYKLVGLLLYRRELPPGAREILFGDDVESDAIIYALYADILAGRIRGAELLRILQRHKTEYQLAEWIVAFADRVPVLDTVQRIFIHLANASEPERFAPYGSTIVPVHDPFQAAVVLEGERKISSLGVLRIAAAMREAGVSDVSLLTSFLDARRRKLRGGPGLDALGAKLSRTGHLPVEVRFAPSAPLSKGSRRTRSREPILPASERA